MFWDVLRGVAVLGVLLANIPWMTLARHVATEGEGKDPELIDRLTKNFVFFVADAKFITTFSILFGAGLMWMSLRASERGAKFVPTYTRRLSALLGFGLIHGTCIWFGDILTTYALTGFLAIAFHHRRVKTIAIWTAALFVLSVALWSILPLLRSDGGAEPPDPSARIAEIRDTYSSGDFLRMVGARSDVFFTWLVMMMIFFTPRTLSMFLIGMLLVKSSIFTKPAEHRTFYRRACFIGIPLGVACHVVAFAADALEWPARHSIEGFLFGIGSLAQALGYIGAIQMWTESSLWAALRARLAAVGRMAFTNYLMHSVITGIAFNYCGLFDRITRWQGLFVVAAIYGLQLWYSPLWLARFRMGPLEWIWRTLTYGKRPAFVRAAVPLSAPPEATPPPMP